HPAVDRQRSADHAGLRRTLEGLAVAGHRTIDEAFTVRLAVARVAAVPAGQRDIDLAAAEIKARTTFARATIVVDLAFGRGAGGRIQGPRTHARANARLVGCTLGVAQARIDAAAVGPDLSAAAHAVAVGLVGAVRVGIAGA